MISVLRDRATILKDINSWLLCIKVICPYCQKKASPVKTRRNLGAQMNFIYYNQNCSVLPFVGQVIATIALTTNWSPTPAEAENPRLRELLRENGISFPKES